MPYSPLLKSVRHTLLWLIIPCFLLIGLGSQWFHPPVLAATPDLKGMKMALILSGPAKDGSWNQVATEAGEALKKKGVEVAMVESVAVPDAERVIRQYAESGYSLVVAHSFNYQDAAFKVAKEYPKVNFSWAGGTGRASTNVADYDQPFYEGAYLVGMLGAKLSKDAKLGALYGFDIPVCKAMGKAMLAGAKQTRPEATLTDAAVGDWMDVSKAKEAAVAQAGTGVDFWIGCGQGPTWGTIEAAKAQGGFSTGYVGNMFPLGPEVVASNVIWNMEPLFEQMLSDTKAGQYANKVYRLGIADKVIRIDVNPKLKDKIGSATLKQVEEMQQKIATGQFKVPFEPK